MAEVEVDTSEWQDLSALLTDMTSRAKNLDPVLIPAAQTLSTVITKSFEQSNSPLGGAWAPLADSTVRGRRRGSSKPLVDTGALRGSIATQAEGDKIRFGISGAPATYGGVHQVGTRTAGRKRNTTIDARPFLPIDGGKADFSSGRAKTWLDRLQKRVLKYILGT